MKKTLLRVLSLAAAGALVQGCASVEVCTRDNDMVLVQNSGCYLFCCLPLCSGDPDYPNQQVCNWFDDTVSLETNMRLLKDEAEKRGATGVRNIASHADDELLLWVLLTRRTYTTSAELTRN